MKALVLSVVLAAAPVSASAATPRAPRAAGMVVFLPHLDRTTAVVHWLERGGERAVVLRPTSWQSEFHPLLHVDPTRAASLEENGLSPTGSATVSVVAESRVTCATLADPARFEQRSTQALEARGELVKQKLGAQPVLAAQVGDEWVAGVVIRGKEACAVVSPHATRALLQEATRLLASNAGDARFRGADLGKGAVFFSTRHGPVSVQAEGDALLLDGKLPAAELATLEPRGDSPYASVPPSGLLFARAHVARSDLGQVIGAVVTRVKTLCPACDPKAVASLGAQLQPHLTGQLLVRADRFQPGKDLRTPAGRFFALKLAGFAEVDQGPAVAQLLATAARWPGAHAVEGGVALGTPAGTLTLGVRDRQLFVADDTDALAALLALPLGKPGPLAHPLEVELGPRSVLQAFSRVSLLDVVGSPELAAMFAAGTEIGPLFQTSRQVALSADPAGAQVRVQGRWVLEPAAAEAPPSAPAPAQP